MSEDSVLEESFPSLIHQHGSERADSNALIFHDQVTSWAQYSARVNRVANRLLGEGIGKGGRAVIMGRNTAAYVTAMGGISTAGAVCIPMPTMVTAETALLMLEDCTPDILFVDKYTSPLLAQVLALNPAVIARVVALDFGDEAALAAVNAITLDSWLGDSPADYPGVEILASDPFIIMYSSGTTGTPKGIILGHGTRIGQARNMALLQYKITIISTPLYSLGGMSSWMPTVYAGGCCVLVDKFDEQEFLSMVEKYRVTHMLLVPVQFERLMAQANFDDFDLSSIEFKFGGSAPMTLAAKRELADRFPGEMLEFYSLTEGGVTTALWFSQAPEKLASVGQASNGCVLKIIDEEGNELPSGEIGEIVGRSAVHMEGYLNRGDIASLLWSDGEGEQYFRSGDLGFLDEDGYLFLRDRKKDMIISGGMNVYAVDIEAVLHRHPNVAEATVIGLPSKRWGESPVGLVVLKPGSERQTSEEVQSWANEQLSPSQRLATVELRDELPKNHLGKILKMQLRQALQDALGTLD
jgi:acyl-CoA synthetase (AMP-forming)/AMP-acid ligase II